MPKSGRLCLSDGVRGRERCVLGSPFPYFPGSRPSVIGPWRQPVRAGGLSERRDRRTPERALDRVAPCYAITEGLLRALKNLSAAFSSSADPVRSTDFVWQHPAYSRRLIQNSFVGRNCPLRAIESFTKSAVHPYLSDVDRRMRIHVIGIDQRTCLIEFTSEANGIMPLKGAKRSPALRD